MVDEITLQEYLEIWRKNANTYAPFPVMSAQLLRACDEIEKLERKVADMEKPKTLVEVAATMPERKMIAARVPQKVAKIVLSDGVELEGPFVLASIADNHMFDSDSPRFTITLNGFTVEQCSKFWQEVP